AAAAPLHRSGPWTAAAWAAEAVLLVELGLRFDQAKLRLAGFGLLGVVQMILVFYSLRTFADPAAFETRFIPRTADVVVQGVLPDTPQPVTTTAAAPEVPSWTSIFNGRSFGFLAGAAAVGILSWE